MQFKMVHNNLNVSDLEKSLAFYQEALGLHEVRRKEREGFTLVFLGDDLGQHQLELTWLKDHPQKYELGENETHICFRVKDYEDAKKKHEEMGCVCFVNEAMGLYFIEDPDGYWFEITPER